MNLVFDTHFVQCPISYTQYISMYPGIFCVSVVQLQWIKITLDMTFFYYFLNLLIKVDIRVDLCDTEIQVGFVRLIQV